MKNILERTIRNLISKIPVLKVLILVVLLVANRVPSAELGHLSFQLRGKQDQARMN